MVIEADKKFQFVKVVLMILWGEGPSAIRLGNIFV